MLASVFIMSVLIIGHRGASGHMPENTLPAFEKAIEMQADGVELDIWPDATGVPMVIHDESLSRTTRHKGKVTAMRSADLQPLGVPSYAQVLDMAAGKLIIFTELKGPREEHVGKAISDAVATGGWRYDELPVIGFDHEQLKRLKAAYPHIHIGASFSKKMLEHLPRAKQIPYMISKASAMHAVAINPDYHVVDAELVERAHNAGLKVNVWTVNSAKAMDAMLALGVDAIMTDYPDRLHTKVHPSPKAP